MPEHIKLFCRTPHYSHCRHYIRECEQIADPSRKTGSASGRDRRRFDRVEGRYSLVLADCDEMGRPRAMMTDKARTLDLSLGGMRLESPTDMPASRIISFTFGSDFVSPTLTGIGEVMWCEPVAAAERYIAGLSFSFVDAQMRQAIGSQIGLAMA